ncbi:hypothetical protein HDV03_003941 [Kappamyces sp. JEL0829]|nr:hypothetical protein HDV03_003941 [Kappamyces sp. JEL0829]
MPHSKFKLGYNAIPDIHLPFDSKSEASHASETYTRLNASLAFRLRKYTIEEPLSADPCFGPEAGEEQEERAESIVAATPETPPEPSENGENGESDHHESEAAPEEEEYDWNASDPEDPESPERPESKAGEPEETDDLQSIQPSDKGQEEASQDPVEPADDVSVSGTIPLLESVQLSDSGSEKEPAAAVQDAAPDFMAQARGILKSVPIRTRQSELERMRLLKKTAGTVSKYRDIRKVLGWGPSLAAQKDTNPHAPSGNLVTVPLKKNRLATHKPAMSRAPRGHNVITNSLGKDPANQLPALFYY